MRASARQCEIRRRSSVRGTRAEERRRSSVWSSGRTLIAPEEADCGHFEPWRTEPVNFIIVPLMGHLFLSCRHCLVPFPPLHTPAGAGCGDSRVPYWARQQVVRRGRAAHWKHDLCGAARVDLCHHVNTRRRAGRSLRQKAPLGRASVTLRFPVFSASASGRRVVARLELQHFERNT